MAKKFKKSGFTLAEIMIVLVIIGVLTGILMPIAIHSAPDKNVMKFKKADTTLKNVVRELVNSDKYYENGELIKKVDHNYAQRSDFCLSFADVVSYKSVNCDYDISIGKGFTSICSKRNGTCELNPDRFKAVDNTCKIAEQNASSDDMGILTSDGVRYFEATLDDHFGCIYQGETNSCKYTDSGWSSHIGKSLYGYDVAHDYVVIDNGIKALRLYRIFCIDIDGIGKGEDPFGYGIRADGKIMSGARANEWLEKDFQKGKDE